MDDCGEPLCQANFGGITDKGQLCNQNTFSRCAACHAAVSIREAVVVPPGEFKTGKRICRRCAKKILRRARIAAVVTAVFHPFLDTPGKEEP